MPTARAILCPVDFSEQSRQALLWASMIAQHRGGEMIVLSVVEPLLARAAGIRLGIDLAHADFGPALRTFVEATLPEPVRQASRVRMEVTVGDPSAMILLAGHRHRPEVIVMGTHGLGGIRKLLIGSTTDQVLRRTEWPVLVVPAAVAESIAPWTPASHIDGTSTRSSRSSEATPGAA
jgi:nucleotide-binding universal stress UspA family protein